MTTQKLTARRELRAFLRAKRASIAPSVAGFIGARRRTPGLRVEEVATLAGVGTTWYAAFERGEPIGVSKKMTAAVARALRLSDVERRYLERLLRDDRPKAEIDAPLGEPLAAVIEGFSSGPAFAINGRWDVLAANVSAREAYALEPNAERGTQNLMRRMFLDPTYRTLHVDWSQLAQAMVGILHYEFGRRLDDERYTTLVEELRIGDDDFRAAWDAFRLVPLDPEETTLRRAGALERYRLTKLLGTVSPDLAPVAVIVHTPVAR